MGPLRQAQWVQSTPSCTGEQAPEFLQCSLILAFFLNIDLFQSFLLTSFLPLISTLSEDEDR